MYAIPDTSRETRLTSHSPTCSRRKCVTSLARTSSQPPKRKRAWDCALSEQELDLVILTMLCLAPGKSSPSSVEGHSATFWVSYMLRLLRGVSPTHALLTGAYLAPKPGGIIAPDGKQVGTHAGLHSLTVGQRARIAGAKVPWFVARKDIKQNEVHVVPGG